MSTRSNIALVKKGGAVEAIYCHQNGYPEGIGQTLAKCYGEEEEVAAMLELGDMSLLRDTLEACVFYHRDFGGENTAENTRAERYASLVECVAAQDSDIFIEWLYLFADDRWWVRAWDGDGFYRLADVLDACEQTRAARAQAVWERTGMRARPVTRWDDLKELMDGQGVRPRAFTGHRPPLERRPPERAAPPCPPLPIRGEDAANAAGEGTADGAGESVAERAARERAADRAARRHMRIGRSADSRAHARRRESRLIGGAQAPNPPSP